MVSFCAIVTPSVRAVVSDAATVAPYTIQCFAAVDESPEGRTAMR